MLYDVTWREIISIQVNEANEHEALKRALEKRTEYYDSNVDVSFTPLTVPDVTEVKE